MVIKSLSGSQVRVRKNCCKHTNYQQYIVVRKAEILKNKSNLKELQHIMDKGSCKLWIRLKDKTLLRLHFLTDSKQEIGMLAHNQMIEQWENYCLL